MTREDVKRSRREWGMVCRGLAVGFMLGEVRQVFQPNHVEAWVLGVLILALLVFGFYLTRRSGPG